jgi:demethylmacrocin O-methyltransferase
VATLVLQEIAARSARAPAPDRPVTVAFELGDGERPVDLGLVLGPRAAALADSTRGACVRIRQDLAEFVRAVYGTSSRRHDATRELWIMNEPGPASDDGDDPWLLELRAATLAAGQVSAACCGRSPDLAFLARHFGCDKWGDHFYTAAYERHFDEYRDQRVRLLEIGIGGFESPRLGGESLRMWRHFFRRGLIYGLDLYEKSALDELRVQTVQGDQSDAPSLAALAGGIGPLDIVIDDGSHLSDHVLTSFTTLFPLLADGGIYVIEDLQTSYWPGWNGARTSVDDRGTSVGYLKWLLDALHHQDQMPGGATELPHVARCIRAMHVYHNIAFVEKGVNAEQTAPSWVRRHESDMDLVPKGSMRPLDAAAAGRAS